MKSIINTERKYDSAILGDIVGSRFEFHPIKAKNFDLFQEGDGRKTLANDDEMLAIVNKFIEFKNIKGDL